MSLPNALDEEIRRVAREEDKTMEEIVAEVAATIGCTPRQLYNYRSGKLRLPASMIPILCKRFNSRTLLHVLISECEQTPITVPDQFELGTITTGAVRDVMDHYHSLLGAFDSDGGIDRNELSKLRESSERVADTIWMFYEIAVADYERRFNTV